MKHLHIDATNGIAGDMLLSALVSAGASLDKIAEKLQSFITEEFKLESKTVLRCGISASLLIIEELADSQHTLHHGHHHHHGPVRCFPDIVKLLDNAKLNNSIKKNALRIFEIIAEAEGTVHNLPKDKVHFHEISGFDTIVDIVGCCLAIDELAIESISCSPISVGTGFVNCAHGKMALPAPATAEILKKITTVQLDTGTEICTPTGAALAKGLATDFGVCPPLAIDSIGYGAGNKELKNQANVVRAIIGSLISEEDKNEDIVYQLTSVIDDISGEKIAFAIEQISKAGAIDVYLKSIIMKKNRPGFELTVLTKEKEKNDVELEIFACTKTFGFRVQRLNRKILERKIIEVEIEGKSIGVKVGFFNNKPIVFSAEYEECKALALDLGKDINSIYNEVEYKARELAL